MAVAGAPVVVAAIESSSRRNDFPDAISLDGNRVRRKNERWPTIRFSQIESTYSIHISGGSLFRG
jgi:hypothetical protein